MEKISLTFAEAWHYANLSGNSLWIATGIILLAFAATLLWLLATNRAYPSGGKIAFVFAVIALGICSIIAKPIAIRLNNDKQVSKEYLQEVGRSYILDSMYNNNRMINAAKNEN